MPVKEKIGIADLDTVSANIKYDEINDYQLFDGQIKEECIISKGEFLILFENETHVTAGIVNKSTPINKIVFKVPVAE